jgi:hypothetical protein
MTTVFIMETYLFKQDVKLQEAAMPHSKTCSKTGEPGERRKAESTSPQR